MQSHQWTMQLAGFSETYLPFCRGSCYSAPLFGSAFGVTQLPRNALAAVLIMDLLNLFRQSDGLHTLTCVWMKLLWEETSFSGENKLTEVGI